MPYWRIWNYVPHNGFCYVHVDVGVPGSVDLLWGQHRRPEWGVVSGFVLRPGGRLQDVEPKSADTSPADWFGKRPPRYGNQLPRFHLPIQLATDLERQIAKTIRSDILNGGLRQRCVVLKSREFRFRQGGAAVRDDFDGLPDAAMREYARQVSNEIADQASCIASKHV